MHDLASAGCMCRPTFPRVTAARDTFLAHVHDAETDPVVADLRRALTDAKLETLSQVQGLDEAGLRLVMPGLYQQIVTTTVQIAAHVGLGIGLALECYDEQQSGASVSSFSREVREQMKETGLAMKMRFSNRVAKLVGEVEAQRLAWRHNHEFLSWLAFRRDDPRFPANDRRERIFAFKVHQRLLQSRENVSQLVGRSLAIALEAHDRFMLGNRWKLTASPEHSIEVAVWPLLSFQPEAIVRVELARGEHDQLAAGQAPADKLELAKQAVTEALVAQLAETVDEVPIADVGRIP